MNIASANSSHHWDHSFVFSMYLMSSAATVVAYTESPSSRRQCRRNLSFLCLSNCGVSNTLGWCDTRLAGDSRTSHEVLPNDRKEHRKCAQSHSLPNSASCWRTHLHWLGHFQHHATLASGTAGLCKGREISQRLNNPHHTDDNSLLQKPMF